MQEQLFSEVSPRLKPVAVSVEERMEAAVAVLERFFLDGVTQCISFSSGKDSTCVLILAFMAAVRAVARGAKPVLVILNADTGVENPIVHSHARAEMGKAAAYGRSLGIEVRVAVASPNPLSSWLLRIVGGRALPSFPQSNSDCSIEWKQRPMQSLRARLLDAIHQGTGREALTLTGSRFAESAARADKMEKRGESASVPFRNKAGELILSPICLWTDDDVWELLGYVRNGFIRTYTDTEDLHGFYADAGPTSCAVINDAISEGSAAARGGCGARSGCWCCVQVANDQSMENLLHKRPEYGFMRGLSDLRQFISATQFDMTRRQWVGRSIKHGFIAVQPDAYHPAMLRELWRYALTIHVREEEESRRLGILPRFSLVTPAAVVALDALWSLQGYLPPLTALADFRDIVRDGARYEVPKLAAFPEPAQWPEPRFYYVGEHWDEELRRDEPFTGLRDPFVESLTEMSGCVSTRVPAGQDRVVLDVPESDCFSVDEEGAALLLAYELDHLLELRQAIQTIGGYSQGYLKYVQYGCMTLARGQWRQHDEFLRRTAWKERHGLCGPDYDVRGFIARSIPWHQAPEAVQEAFIHGARLGKLREQRAREALRARQHTLAL